MRTLRHAAWLAIRHVLSARWTSAVLVGGLSVAMFLPSFTWFGVGLLEAQLTRRADRSPILVGHVGNDFDLTMATLYFRGEVRTPIPHGYGSKLRDYGQAIPIHVGHSAGGAPVVGTSLGYLRARSLVLESGRPFAVLGEVVLGAEVARSYQLGIEDRVRTDLSNLYNLAGAYPHVLEVVGVLGPTGTPDDGAIFADVRTAWMLDGAFHGHEAVTAGQALNPDTDEDNLEATAALFMVQEVNAANRGSFHLHGDMAEQPLSAWLVLPTDQRAHDQLLGDLALEERFQAVRPRGVVDTVLGIVARVEEAANLFYALVALSTLAFSGLILALSLRLRQDELRLMVRIGSSQATITLMVVAEIVLIASTSAMLAGLATWIGLGLVAARLGS
jgi:putative ABC transport system permease protein